MKRFKIYSGLKTPDGTILHSKHRHDCVMHKDANGKVYMIDGGADSGYTRCSGHKDEELIEVYSDEPFEKVRQYCYRMSLGDPKSKDYPKQQIVFLKDMTDEHLNALLTYCLPVNQYLPLYKQEIEYRKENNITIKDK
jgi:hypothetical protein